MKNSNIFSPKNIKSFLDEYIIAHDDAKRRLSVAVYKHYKRIASLHKNESELEKRNILTSWVVILSITTFTLSMCGTFLVRSGILNSVHTFANDPE